MNYRIIAYIVGWIFNLQAIFMVLPCITALIYQEDELYDFLIPILICLAIGLALTRKKPKNKVFYIKDGCVTVALSWIVLSVSGALPFIISGSILHPIDAIFETVSGFTTTGSSILTDVEILPRSIIFWRSFPTGSGEWGFLCFFSPSFHWPEATT